MLETYPTKKFHLSPEIEVVEVENVGFPSDSLCKLHTCREFSLKINQNQQNCVFSPAGGEFFVLHAFASKFTFTTGKPQEK